MNEIDKKQTYLKSYSQTVIYRYGGLKKFQDFVKKSKLPVMTLDSKVTNKTIFNHQKTLVSLRQQITSAIIFLGSCLFAK